MATNMLYWAFEHVLFFVQSIAYEVATNLNTPTQILDSAIFISLPAFP